MADTPNGTLHIRGARLVLPGGVVEDSTLLVEHGRIARLSSPGGDAPGDLAIDADAPAPGGDVLALDGLTLYPGFIDIHIHGSVGVDTLEADAARLHTVARFLARHGVTAWLPTLVPAPDEDYASAAQAVGQLMREQDDPARPVAARALGLHYEGPFVNEAQCGALRTPFFRTFKDASDLDALATVAHENAVHMTTLAPEIDGGIELVRALAARGWVVSIGHTRATPATLARALDAGARHMTHFLNAMSPLHHRAPGPIGWGLMNDDVTCDVIADGVHSDPLMLRLVLRCKTAARVALISDAVAPAGLGDGEYRVWDETITVTDGRTSNAHGAIAGSVITMNDAVGTMHALGVAPHDIARMASANPARLLGIADTYGSIEQGKRADLVALDADGRVRLTIVGGRVVRDEG